jgi:hypothetical protein
LHGNFPANHCPAKEVDVERTRTLAFVSTLLLLPASLLAQERTPTPYFVTYDHYLEEQDDLELSANGTIGRDDDINNFVGNFNEFEYGARRWWTTELYLDFQHTNHEGSLFTGWRWENRFRPLVEPHKINPVLYVEYEHLNGADKTLKEIVGFDSKEDLAVPNDVAKHEKERELETKLILSSDIADWNLSENFIGVKNVHGGPWEFGYAVGLSRPLAHPSGRRCTFCAEKFVAGIEVYGGLGEWGDFTFRNTSQYIAPLVLWMLPGEFNLRFSPGWGLTDRSVHTLFRIGISTEIDDFGKKLGKLFH